MSSKGTGSKNQSKIQQLLYTPIKNLGEQQIGGKYHICDMYKNKVPSNNHNQRRERPLEQKL